MREKPLRRKLLKDKLLNRLIVGKWVGKLRRQERRRSIEKKGRRSKDLEGGGEIWMGGEKGEEGGVRI